MKVLITGVAGFIGAALADRLLSRGDEVVGIDNLNDYYDVTLKQARLARLEGRTGFVFHKLSIADRAGIEAIEPSLSDVTHIVNLAAQAGVRYSLVNPYAYIETNVMGFTILQELARRLPQLQHFVYASSSSVYGGNTKVPFATDDPVEKPVSVYAATKRSNELIAHTYAHLYGTPQTGLRFFTVYGPWGRPDMAAYLFCKNIVASKPIPVFNNGEMRRDFTYIDDIITGVLAVLDAPAPTAEKGPPCKVYNIGNSRCEKLMDYIAEIERALDMKAEYDLLPMQAGDVPETFADISATTRDFGYHPATTIAEGIPHFVEWFKAYHGV